MRRVVILAHNLHVAGGRSVGLNLIAALAKLAPELDYTITIPRGVGYEQVCSEIPHCKTVVFDHAESKYKRFRFERSRLPQLVAASDPDLVLALGNYGLISPPCPQVVFVQSAYLFYPRKHVGRRPLLERIARNLRLLAQKRHFTRQLPKTDLLLCQTQAAEKQLRRILGYAGPVMIVPNAVSARVEQLLSDPPFPEALEPVRDKFRLFCLARYYPHKNLEVILETFGRFRQPLRDVAVILTVEDDGHAESKRFLRHLEKAQLQDSVINVGRLAQRELAQYYAACHALFLPTLLESFTGTYVEAMHFERPILTSDLDFAHAVCGDAALYFDPWSPESIREAIERLRADSALAADLVAKGSARLAKLARSWEEIAADLLVELRKIAEA